MDPCVMIQLPPLSFHLLIIHLASSINPFIIIHLLFLPLIPSSLILCNPDQAIILKLYHIPFYFYRYPSSFTSFLPFLSLSLFIFLFPLPFIVSFPYSSLHYLPPSFFYLSLFSSLFFLLSTPLPPLFFLSHSLPFLHPLPKLHSPTSWNPLPSSPSPDNLVPSLREGREGDDRSVRC